MSDKPNILILLTSQQSASMMRCAGNPHVQTPASDHGDMDSAHRMEHKSTYYDEVCRIPLIVTAPDSHRCGHVETRLVSNGLDLVPTLCDYAGAELPKELKGRSWRPLVEDRPGVAWRQHVPVEFAFGHAVVDEHHKHVLADFGESAEQLMDLDADPWETRNALSEPSLADRLADLRRAHVKLFPGRLRDPATVLEDMTAG